MALSGVYVQYYRAPSPPPSAWKTDLPRIRDAGFAGIQLRPQWRWHERQDGRFVWDDLHELCDLAKRHDLRVVVQFIAEMAPDWLLAKHQPYRHDLTGAVRPPGAISAMYVGGWEPCYDHPAVIEYGSRFIREGVRALRHHACIEAWHVWNEPRSRPGWECGCRYSVEAYRQWLRRRYGTIEALNAAFGKAWGDFDWIQPPQGISDYAEMFLWRTWAIERVAGRVGWAAAAARQADPSRPVWSHVGFATIGQNPLNDGSPDWLVAQQVDRYGLSVPVRGSLIGELDAQRWPLSVPMLCDWLRCVSPHGRYHAWEIYPDLGSGIPRMPAAWFERWLWQAAASGPDRLCIWQYRSERLGTESGDAGLVEVDGTDKPHRQAATRFIETWNARREVLDELRPARPRVWIAYDFASHLLWNIEQQADAAYASGSGPQLAPRPQGRGRPTLHAWYHIFRMAGFEVGWLSCDLLAAGKVELPEADSLIVLPSLYMLDDAVADRLAAWTRSGGRLLVVAGTGSRQAGTWVAERAPNGPLVELLGLTERVYRWDTGEPGRHPLRTNAATTEPVWRLATACPAAGAAHEVLASWPDGTAALTAVRADRGQALWLGAALDVDDAETVAAGEQVIPIILGYLQFRAQIGGDGSDLSCGWLSRPYERRLAEHPKWGKFVWVFAPTGAEIGLSPCGWERAWDWLSGEPVTLPGRVGRPVMCIGPHRPPYA